MSEQAGYTPPEQSPSTPTESAEYFFTKSNDLLSLSKWRVVAHGIAGIGMTGGAAEAICSLSQGDRSGAAMWGIIASLGFLGNIKTAIDSHIFLGESLKFIKKRQDNQQLQKGNQPK